VTSHFDVRQCGIITGDLSPQLDQVFVTSQLIKLGLIPTVTSTVIHTNDNEQIYRDQGVV